jgi:parallel beta-helix repeat protein
MTVDVGIYGSWNGVSNCTISNCICSNFFKDGMWIKSLAGTSILACKCNNNSIKGIAIAGPCIVTSCECSNNGWDGISLAESSQASIGNCRCTDNGYRGIDIYAGQNVSITNCDIHQNKYDGIRLSGSSHCIITGNRIEDNGKKLNNTYAGIYLGVSGTVGSSYTTIQSNRIRKGSSPTQKYGIQIADSYCTGNMVTNNDLYSSGVTGSLSDAGTGTITTAGNRL